VSISSNIKGPLWVARMYAGKTGRDHLGLGSVSSDQILPSLSPGINVLTFHPRYHSFYVFILDEYWRQKRPRSHRAWVKFFRPREFIFSIGAYLCDRPEHVDMGTIVGGRKTGPLAAQKLDSYDSQTDYIDSELGGYGLYYRSVMIELGLVIPGGLGFPLPVDVPTERGKEVAAAFRAAIQDTSYYKSYFEKDETLVTLAVIQEYIRKACLCQLQCPEAPDRPLLLDGFLHLGDNASARRATFQLFLDVAAQTKRKPLFQYTFRQLLFFGKTEDGSTYKPSPKVIDIYHRWRLYQAREYYAFALNTMWYYVCDWGIAQQGDAHPIPLSALWNHIQSTLDVSKFGNSFGCTHPNLNDQSEFHEFINWLRNICSTKGEAFDNACTLSSPINEDRLYSWALEQKGAPTTIIGMLTMLSLIYLRFGNPALWMKPEWEIARMGADIRLSLDGFIRHLDNRQKSPSFTLSDACHWLINDYVITQHQLIASSKLPENTFRFQREGGRLRFFKLENSVDFMDSRFNAIQTTVHELGLCGSLDQTKHTLSPDGRQILEVGDL
jgi:hypothetical protein